MPATFLPSTPNRRWRISLRTRGVAVLLLPLIGLFIAFWDIYRTEKYLNDEQDVVVREFPSGLSADQLRRVLAEREAVRQHAFEIVVFCGIAGPFAALFLNWFFSGRLVRRIRAIEENARRFACGLEMGPLPLGNDEIGAMAQSLAEIAALLRKREWKILESELRYRTLFDHAPFPFEEIDSQGMIRRVNQAACDLLKTAPEDLLGRPAWHFLPADVQDDFSRAMLARIAAGTEIAPFECTLLLEDAVSRPIEIHESLMRDETGAATGICRSIIDISDRNMATLAASKVAQYAMELRNKNQQLADALEAARSAAAAKSRFLASMSHELRTPLNAIIGFSELMYDGKLGPISEAHRECLTDILNSARHLLGLISEILDLSKIEAGKMDFYPESCNIDDLAAEVRDVIRPLADKKRITLAAEVPGRVPAVIDPSRFKQILYNYLSNAVKFTPEGGHIVLRVEVDGENFRVDVEDTGVGIPPEEIPKLFEEFQQLSNSRKAGQGTGLGLALTRRLVEAQGGSVAVQSTPGTGSIFSAVLPLRPRSASPLPASGPVELLSQGA